MQVATLAALNLLALSPPADGDMLAATARLACNVGPELAARLAGNLKVDLGALLKA